ncbi:MAG: translation initiation factor IF-2 [Clostridia bacterium]|nr:translation initiation factor IF-2 [Clostridia bacterium]
MAKLRVYELAKELNLANKELLTKIEKMGIEVKNHMSSLEDEEVSKIRDEFNPKKREEKKVEVKKEKKKEIKKVEEKKQPKKMSKDLSKKVVKKYKKKVEKVVEEEENEDDIRMVKVPEVTNISELGCIIGRSATEIIKYLMLEKGVMATINQELDFETSQEIAEHFDVLVEKQEEEDVLKEVFTCEDCEDDMVKRAPVVVVMGHVDHGKTSLLDAIRSTNVIEGEAGGITQHIGASVVEHNGEKITFLDTPGHEAFTAMRLRGAKATDIAILVVAADDGVMPQTIEAISHARAAGVPIIVAVNKIDKVGANPDRVKQELTEHGLIAEDWGGETICMNVSALKGQGINELLDTLLLVAEMEELTANPNKKATGSVIEAKLEKGRGIVTSLLVNEGTLRVGEPVIAGTAFGKVRAMMDANGNKIKEAGPSTPVEILGLNEAPTAGEIFYSSDDERQVRKYAEQMVCKLKQDLVKQNKGKVSLDDLFTQIKEGNMKNLNIIVKADVHGSVEAIKHSLEKLSNEEVLVKVLHGAVGPVSESDVTLASASGAIIIGFNVRPTVMAEDLAKREEVDLRFYRIIYNAIEEVEAAMKGMLDPEFEEKVTGTAEVRKLFKVSGVGTIAGSYITSGEIKRNSSARLVREGIIIHEGPLASLKREKDDAKEVKKGFECGIMFENYNDLKEGDIIEGFIMEEIKR